MKQSNNEDILLSVGVYQNILNNKLKRFPMGFWQEEDPAEIIKYLIEEHLKWTDDDIKKYLCVKTFGQNKLAGMLYKVFNNSPYKAINYAYPDKFQPWELSCAPFQFWTNETAIKATKWLIEVKLKWSDEDIKNNLDSTVFENNGLRGMLAIVYNYSTFEAINLAYPGRFKPWELKHVSCGFWSKETAIEAIKWLIEEKLQWSEDIVKKKLTGATFRDNGLGGMISKVFNNSPFQAINSAYPGRFKPWELKKMPSHYLKQINKKAV